MGARVERSEIGILVGADGDPPSEWGAPPCAPTEDGNRTRIN
jgi:hypothetical protein